MGYEFELDPRRSTRDGGERVSRRSARRRPSPRRATPWAWWLVVALLGTSLAVTAAVIADEVRAIGDTGFQRAAGGILVVLVLSLPGFALFQLGRSRERTMWRERWWRPTILARLSLLASVGAAFWCGYLIAVRIAREWPV